MSRKKSSFFIILSKTKFSIREISWIQFNHCFSISFLEKNSERIFRTSEKWRIYWRRFVGSNQVLFCIPDCIISYRRVTGIIIIIFSFFFYLQFSFAFEIRPKYGVVPNRTSWRTSHALLIIREDEIGFSRDKNIFPSSNYYQIAIQYNVDRFKRNKNDL